MNLNKKLRSLSKKITLKKHPDNYRDVFFNFIRNLFIKILSIIKTPLIMKKIVYSLVICFAIISCTTEGESYSLEVLPVAKVEMQTAFAKDSITEIPVKYLRPSNCHFFEDFYYVRNDFTRIVAIYNSRLNKDNCSEFANDTIEVPLRFRPTQLGTYTLRFWKGTVDGVEEYYEYQAEVNH
jgi:hypothetical protein